MQTWREKSAEKIADLDRQREERRAAKTDESRRGAPALRAVPMTARVQKIIAELPEEERQQPRPLAFFQELLRAKYPCRGIGRASPGEVGTALRQLGWTRTRSWRGEAGGFRALWVPPTNPAN